jgi:hypothetical protein
MLYRFNNSVDAELADPLRWSFTRPLTGVLMGIIAYLAFKIGLLVLQPMSAPDGATVTRLSAPQELLWLAAFLAGFSDRFADSVLRSLAGRLGGDRQAELHTAEQTMSSTGSVMRDLADRLGWGKPLTSATAIEQSRAVLPTVEPPEPPPRTGALAQTRRSRKRAGAQTGETTPQISLGEPNTVVAFPESVPKEGI